MLCYPFPMEEGMEQAGGNERYVSCFWCHRYQTLIGNRPFSVTLGNNG